MIAKKYNNYFKYEGKWYIARSFKPIYPITSEIKRLFHLYSPLSLSLKWENKRYWLEEAIIGENGDISEIFPLKYFKDRDDKFNEKLKQVIFYRYMMGFQSNEGSIWVGYDGNNYFPISHKEGKTYERPETGKIFKITPTKALPTDHIIRINPTNQLKILFDTSNLEYDHISGLVEKIRKIILKHNLKLCYLALDIRDRLTEYTQFE